MPAHIFVQNTFISEHAVKDKEFKPLAFFICVAIPLLGGIAVGLLTSGQTEIYSRINTPSFAPPSFLFPIVWGILYALMGISLYLVYSNGGGIFNYIIFGAQLAANFLWPFLFFTFEAFTAAFVCLCVLLVLIVIMIISFYKKSKLAGLLQLPYLLWVIFAGVLNLSIAILN